MSIREIEWIETPMGLTVAKTPLTQAQWEFLDRPNPSIQLGAGLPLHNLVEKSITKICQNMGWRLPTAEEWKTFALAGLTLKDYQPMSNYAVMGSHRLPMVGTKDPNPWGLYDCFGLIWEMVKVPGELGVRYCGQCYNMPLDTASASCYSGNRIEPKVVGFRPVKDIKP